ncbi:MAG TPA: hypothetical protein VKY90_13840 [Candidatus Dormibacteraeota bacterium]|nr:hypothetical protein [Candidatus Dormibacteraeota bacterium]
MGRAPTQAFGGLGAQRLALPATLGEAEDHLSLFQEVRKWGSRGWTNSGSARARVPAKRASGGAPVFWTSFRWAGRFPHLCADLPGNRDDRNGGAHRNRCPWLRSPKKAWT